MRELMYQNVFGNPLYRYLLSSGIVFLGLLVAQLFSLLLSRVGAKLAAKTKNEIDDIVVANLRPGGKFLIVVSALYAAITVFSIQEEYLLIIGRAYRGLATAAVAWFGIKIFDQIFVTVIQPLANKTDTKLDDQLIPILRKTIKISLVVFSCIIILDNVGYDITTVLAGVGIGGMAIALASQETVANFFGSISIFADKPFMVGETIQFGDTFGTVEEVGIRSTIIKQFDDTIVVVPNKTIADAVIINRSRRTRRREILVLGLTYDTTAERVEEARGKALQILAESEGVEPDTFQANFRSFGDFTLNLEIIYYITDLDNWRAVIHQVNVRMKHDFDAAGLDFAFPTQTLYVQK